MISMIKILMMSEILAIPRLPKNKNMKQTL